jgi:RHS repeat-associated protein
MGDSHEEALAYDEFGVPAVEMSGSLHNPFGFTGYQADDVSGLCYSQARYYAPTVGRFSAEDTVRDGVNYYLYCYSNPLIFVDRNGLWGKDCHKDQTETAGRNVELPPDMIDSLVYYNNATDFGSTGFLPLIGNQAYHFNRSWFWERDSREKLAELHLQAAIDIMNGNAGHLPRLLPFYKIDAGFNREGGLGIDLNAQKVAMLGVNRGSRAYRRSITDIERQVVNSIINDHAVRQELALMHIGMGLHALQDIHAHGQYNAGPTGFTGHGIETVWNSIFGNTIFNASDFDSVNYEWGNIWRTKLRPTANPYENPRVLAAINQSTEYLLQFLGAVEHTPSCTD